jgi:hypothetical protein
MRRLFPLLGITGLLFAGCGAGDESDSETTAPSTSAPVKTSPAPNTGGTSNDVFKQPAHRAVLVDKTGDARPAWDITNIASQTDGQSLMVEVHYRDALHPTKGGQGMLIAVEIDIPHGFGPSSDGPDYEVASLRGSQYDPDRLVLTKGLNLKYAPCDGLRFTPSYEEKRVSFEIPRSCLGKGADKLRVKGYSYLIRGPSGWADYVDRWSRAVAFD